MSSEDYFELKYNEEINELLNECKDLLNYYQVPHYKNDHMDFLYFIMDSVHIHYNDDSDSESENEYSNEIKYKE